MPSRAFVLCAGFTVLIFLQVDCCDDGTAAALHTPTVTVSTERSLVRWCTRHKHRDAVSQCAGHLRRRSRDSAHTEWYSCFSRVCAAGSSQRHRLCTAASAEYDGSTAATASVGCHCCDWHAVQLVNQYYRSVCACAVWNEQCVLQRHVCVCHRVHRRYVQRQRFVE